MSLRGLVVTLSRLRGPAMWARRSPDSDRSRSAGIRHGRKRDISGGDSFFLTREFLAQMMGASNATAFHWSQASCNARVSSIAGAGVSTCSTSKGLREISFECYATVKATGEGLAWRSPASNISAHFRSNLLRRGERMLYYRRGGEGALA